MGLLLPQGSLPLKNSLDSSLLKWQQAEKLRPQCS